MSRSPRSFTGALTAWSVTGCPLLEISSGSFAEQVCDAGHQRRHVTLLVVQEPLAELYGGGDDLARAGLASVGELRPQLVGHLVAREEELRQDAGVLERLG